MRNFFSVLNTPLVTIVMLQGYKAIAGETPLSFKKDQHMIYHMRGSRNFRQGGGGGPGQSDKKSSDNVYFFLVLSLFYSQMVNLKKKLSFFEVLEGSNIFQGGPTFSRGGPIAYSL